MWISDWKSFAIEDWVYVALEWRWEKCHPPPISLLSFCRILLGSPYGFLLLASHIPPALCVYVYLSYLMYRTSQFENPQIVIKLIKILKNWPLISLSEPLLNGVTIKTIAPGDWSSLLLLLKTIIYNWPKGQ